MSNPDVNQLDSMLSYVANRDGNRPPSFFDKEIRSWLMMATELVPSTIPDTDKPPSSDLIQNNVELNSGVGINSWDEERGFPSVDSPYLNSQSIFSSPLGIQPNGINSSRHNSIDFLSLPNPAYQQTPVESFSNADKTDSLSQSSFFATNDSTVIKEFPLPSLSAESSKRSQSSTSTDAFPIPMEEDPEVIKKRRRLEKNRQTAKTCRQRKKEHKEALQLEIRKLREENNSLRHQLENLSDESKVLHQHYLEHKQFMDKIKACASSNDEEGIFSAINDYYGHWSKLGEERSSAADVHLEQLKMLLLPTQMSKMCLWSMGQEDEFYDEKLNNLKYGGSIWNILSQACGFTDEQKKAIISSRSGMLRQQENIASVLDIVNDVQERVKSNIESMHEQMRGILNVLSPSQQAKFLIWVEGGMNGADLISSVQKVLQMQKKPAVDVGEDSVSLSVSENESFSSIGNL